MEESLVSQPMFPEERGVEQLVEITGILGTPTREEIKYLNPDYTCLSMSERSPNLCMSYQSCSRIRQI